MGIMTLNDSGRYLWRKLEERDCTAAALVDALLEEYEVERSTATTDVDNFIHHAENDKAAGISSGAGQAHISPYFT